MKTLISIQNKNHYLLGYFLGEKWKISYFRRLYKKKKNRHNYSYPIIFSKNNNKLSST